MSTQKLPVEQFVKDQLKKWKRMQAQKDRKEAAAIPVITVSSEPGSGGTLVAQGIAKRLDFDYFNRDIVEGIAKSAEIRSTVIDSIEKQRLSGFEDFIASVIKAQYLYPGIYLRHLLKVVATIGKHGRAVIVGRGANFILPPDERFSVRIIAPLEKRVRNVADWHKTSLEKAQKRIIRRESKRRAFIRQSFNAKITDPQNYDLTANTGNMSIEAAVAAVIGAVKVRASKAS